MNIRLFYTLSILSINSILAYAQSQALDPEAGSGTYKNRAFFNLEKYWDSTTVLNNPHKGWNIHFYDNSTMALKREREIMDGLYKLGEIIVK